MTHAVFGLGVVGSAVRALLEESGLRVVGYDPAKPEVSVSADQAESAAVWWICVPTPSRPGGRLDATLVTGLVFHAERHGHRPLVIVKSTLPADYGCAYERVAYVPEFLVEADPHGSIRRPDRVVIGVESREPVREVVSIIDDIPAWRGAWRCLLRLREAILVKLGSNAMLAARVSLANEIAEYAGHHGLRWDEIAHAIGLDPRIGHAHLRVPGPDGREGFGGSCLPKDLAELATATAGPVLAAVDAANRERRPECYAATRCRHEPCHEPRTTTETAA